MKHILTVLVISCMILGVISTAVSADAPAGSVKLAPGSGITVTGFGTPWGSGNGYDKAFDGNPGTNTDINGDGLRPWVGLSLDKAYQITHIRFLPRHGYTERANGIFQGANSPDFSDAVLLYEVPGAYAGEGVDIAPGWHDVSVTDTNKYKYVRFFMPFNNMCDISEIEFYTGGGTLPVEPIVWNSNGSVTLTGLTYPATLIVARYDNNGDNDKSLTGIFIKDVTADGTISDPALAALVASGGDLIKTMIWNSIDSIAPCL